MSKCYEVTYIGCLVVFVENAKDKDDAMRIAEQDARMGDWEWDECHPKELNGANEISSAKRFAMVKALDPALAPAAGGPRDR